MQAPKPLLCLDFDGVIHSYMSGWKGAAVIPDPPVPGAIAFIVGAVDHFRVAIYSSRSGQLGGIEAMKNWLADWLLEWASENPGYWPSLPRREAVFEAIEFPTEKPPAMVSIDDRALTFDGSWPSFDALKRFQPWNKGRPVDDFPVTIDRENGRITICGVIYDFDLFRFFAEGSIGATYRLAGREGGVVTIDRLA